MHASDLLETIPTVRGDSTVLDAAKVMLQYGLKALVVVDEHGEPERIVPSSQLMWALVPGYLRHDEALRRVVDEQTADELALRLGTLTMSQLIAEPEVADREMPVVHPEDTLVELAAAIALSKSPVVAVRDASGRYLGVVTASRLTAAALVLTGQPQEPAVRQRLEQDLLPSAEDAEQGNR